MNLSSSIYHQIYILLVNLCYLLREMLQLEVAEENQNVRDATRHATLTFCVMSGSCLRR